MDNQFPEPAYRFGEKGSDKDLPAFDRRACFAAGDLAGSLFYQDWPQILYFFLNSSK